MSSLITCPSHYNVFSSCIVVTSQSCLHGLAVPRVVVHPAVGTPFPGVVRSGPVDAGPAALSRYPIALSLALRNCQKGTTKLDTGRASITRSSITRVSH